MTRAVCQETLDHGVVRCTLCPHHCVLKNRQRGICGVRENIDGTLFALNDGLTIARAADPIEKKPLFHFMPGSSVYSFAAEGCNLDCPWCQNHTIAHRVRQDGKPRGVRVSPDEHVRQARLMGCKGIAYTYSEPTVFIEYALETMKKAREVGLKNIWVSNGMTSDCAIDLLLPWIDAANIDIKASDETSYKRSVNGSFEAVINTIGRFHEACIHIEVTTLVVPGVNDTDDDFKTIAKAIFDILGEKAIWHVTRFFPAYRMNDSDPTPHGRLKLAKEIGHAAGIPIIHLGNI